MRTSETATELALYESACCGEELIFDDGDVFARCPGCDARCEWELIEPIVPCEALDREAA